MIYEQITFSTMAADITDYEIDCAIATGSGFSEGKLRITKFFEIHPDKKERIEMLKKEYGIGGWSHAINDDSRSFLHHDGYGIKLTKGEYQILLKWAQVERIIDRLIKDGAYCEATK